MPRYIDANLLKEQMESVCMGIMSGTDTYNAPLNTIDNAPTANVVEVVRCEDCKWHHYSKISNVHYCTISRCHSESITDAEHDFCSYGERKCNED